MLGQNKRKPYFSPFLWNREMSDKTRNEWQSLSGFLSPGHN